MVIRWGQFKKVRKVKGQKERGYGSFDGSVAGNLDHKMIKDDIK